MEGEGRPARRRNLDDLASDARLGGRGAFHHRGDPENHVGVELGEPRLTRFTKTLMYELANTEGKPQIDALGKRSDLGIERLDRAMAMGKQSREAMHRLAPPLACLLAAGVHFDDEGPGRDGIVLERPEVTLEGPFDEDFPGGVLIHAGGHGVKEVRCEFVIGGEQAVLLRFKALIKGRARHARPLCELSDRDRGAATFGQELGKRRDETRALRGHDLFAGQRVGSTRQGRCIGWP